MSLRIQPIGGSLGAVVTGVDVRDLDDDGIEDLREQLHSFEVVFLTGQRLDDESHLAFAGRLGELRGFAFASVLTGDDDPEPTVTAIRDDADSRPGADNWHTDVTWVAEPPDYAVLRAVTVPASGGDTMWASLTAAYQELSAPMQTFVGGLRVVHDNTSFIEGARHKMPPDQFAALDVEAKLRGAFPAVSHPLVRTHPDTGARALFLGGGFMQRVEGLTEAESEALLGFLARHIDQPRFHVRWRWSEGDVAVWDERTTNHRAVGDHYPQVREVRRIEVGGAVPV